MFFEVAQAVIKAFRYVQNQQAKQELPQKQTAVQQLAADHSERLTCLLRCSCSFHCHHGKQILLLGAQPDQVHSGRLRAELCGGLWQ